jgi:two-component system, cell cycle response regulator
MPSTEVLRVTRDPAAPSTVLVVDDDELVRAHLSAVLRFAGFSVQTADSAERALQMLEQTPTRLVLADWEMPGMDGLELCRAIRERPVRSYVYVLLLTIRGDPGDVLAGFDAGADDYVIKGGAVEELVARLESGRRIVAYHEIQARYDKRRQPPTTTAPLAPSLGEQDIHGRLAMDYDRCRQHAAAMSVIACGIDYLDCVADRFGAGVAGSVLASLGSEIGKRLLEMDWVATLDSSTLLVVLPHATLETAIHVAGKARTLIADGARFSTTGIPLTASIGVASMEQPGDFWRYDPMSLLSTAVQSLERSRQRGGDSVTSAYVQPLTA